MRVYADTAPANAFSMERRPKRPDHMLVRFYENVKDEEVGVSYDEYHLELAYYDNLQIDILNNFDGWLRAAKSKEESQNALANTQSKAELNQAVVDYNIMMGVLLDPEEGE